MRQIAKAWLLRLVGALTGRHPVLLQPEAAADGTLLRTRGPYRIDGPSAELAIDEPGPGEISLELLAYEGHFPRLPVWQARAGYAGPCRLALDLSTGAVTLGETPLGTAPMPLPSRRFCWHLRLDTPGGRRERLTSHYQADASGSYYQGGNYVDYDAEARGEVPLVLDLCARHGVEGPMLEIGCATGLVLEALLAAGYDACGVDYSAWAIEQAGTRVDPGRVALCNVETDGLPAAIASRGPFRALLLWAVLEHFRDPFCVLETLSAHLAPGGILLINTTNVDSLNRWLFGRDWEGYVDPTHFGVEQVGAASLRQRLPALGFRILELTTQRAWDGSADPTRVTLREWWAADARFRRLLEEQERGDLLLCAAVREPRGAA